MTPCVASCNRVVVGVVGVSEMGEDMGVVAKVAEFFGKNERLLVVGSSLRGMAEALVGMGEIVQRDRLTIAIAEFPLCQDRVRQDRS